MNKLTTLQLVLIGIASALLIAAIVCYFYAPRFTFFVSGLLVGALGGFIGGYFVGKKQFEG